MYEQLSPGTLSDGKSHRNHQPDDAAGRGSADDQPTPRLVKLLEGGIISHERVSTRRTVLLADMLAGRDSRRAVQIAALEATRAPFEDEDDPEKAVRLLAKARAAVGRAHAG